MPDQSETFVNICEKEGPKRPFLFIYKQFPIAAMGAIVLILAKIRHNGTVFANSSRRSRLILLI
jgi:hypothetical protein